MIFYVFLCDIFVNLSLAKKIIYYIKFYLLYKIIYYIVLSLGDKKINIKNLRQKIPIFLLYVRIYLQKY